MWARLLTLVAWLIWNPLGQILLGLIDRATGALVKRIFKGRRNVG